MSACRYCGDETCGQNRAVLETWTLDRDCLARTADRARAAEEKLAESAEFERLYYEQVELTKEATDDDDGMEIVVEYTFTPEFPVNNLTLTLAGKPEEN